MLAGGRAGSAEPGAYNIQHATCKVLAILRVRLRGRKPPNLARGSSGPTRSRCNRIHLWIELALETQSNPNAPCIGQAGSGLGSRLWREWKETRVDPRES